ncbi:MAG TPA: APC family permease, partial [Streptosporangiaceae bacterium]
VMVALAGASAPLIFLISMVGMAATASSLAQFAGVYPSAGSFITYITRAIGTKVATAIGVITVLGYIIAFGGIYIFVGSYIVQNVLGNPHVWGITQIVTIIYGALVVAPVIVGLKFGVRVTVALYLFEIVLLLALSLTILARGGANGLSATPFTWPGGSKDVLIAFSLAVLAFGGFEAAAPLAEETRNPRRNVPLAVLGAVVVSGIIYVVGSYALVTAFGVGHAGTLAADPNPFHTAANTFIPFVAPLITWVFLSSVTSSYVAANTQTSRVIFAGARGGLWPHALAAVSPRFRTPAAAAVAFVAPSILIGVVSTAFTDPVTASGFLGTFGILGLIIMYFVANLALIVEWVKFRRRGISKNPWLWVVTPAVGVVVLAIPIWGDLRPGQASPFNILPWLTLGLIAVGVIYALVLGAVRPGVLDRAPALLEGEESLEHDPLLAKDLALPGSEHGHHQVAQRAGEVVLTDQQHVVVDADVVHGGAGNRAIRRRLSRNAADEILPAGGVAAAGGVDGQAAEGTVPCDLCHHKHHAPILSQAGGNDHPLPQAGDVRGPADGAASVRGHV